MGIITRKIAGWGCSFMLIVFTIALILAIKNSITWLTIVSIIAIIIYGIGISIVIYDYIKYG